MGSKIEKWEPDREKSDSHCIFISISYLLMDITKGL